MTTKLLLDTDIGGDIDDAVAVAYLIAHAPCELLGITTVTGQPERRAMRASALCRVAGRDVPIYPGSAEPLLVGQRQPVPEQAVALDRWPHETVCPPGGAIEFLRRTIRAYPGELTLLAIGPVTNVALLFKADPEVATLLKAMVMMGGAILGPPAEGTPPGSQIEWNVLLDPQAAAIVYRTPIQSHRSVGLDVTSRVVMNADEVRERFRAPPLRPLVDFAGVWFQENDRIIFHDPLAAATIFDEGLCSFERGTTEVRTCGDTAGTTVWTADRDGPHEIAASVDVPRFFDDYFAVFD